jgi:hypothetical protein
MKGVDLFLESNFDWMPLGKSSLRNLPGADPKQIPIVFSIYSLDFLEKSIFSFL